MSEPVRYGIVGTGMMGREHIANLRHIDDARIVSIADPNEHSRRHAVAEGGLDGVAEFADHRDLVAAGGIDAVLVASPNDTHIDVLLDVLDAGINVLVEKPLCTTVDDCRRVMEAAERSPGVTWVGLEYRYMPPVARMIEEVRKGTVGDVKMVGIREHRYPFLPKVDNWNRFNRRSGGTLVEKCCHFFDLMNLIVGAEPVRVFASGGQAVNHLDEVYDGERSDILDHAYVVVDYAGGTRAFLDLCMFAETSKFQEEIAVVGPLGKVEALVPSPLDIEGLGAGTVRIGVRTTMKVEEFVVHDDPRVEYTGDHHGSSYLEHLAFIEAVRTGSAPEVSLRDGLLSVAVGIAGQRSIEQGRPVEMAEILGSS
ncbi:MAG: Gfo/Idh/MocA family oxidoreductase [Acidimicrobiia bacterium]|nr:Gfo/Idh/MocA family oxidoreductase [Acidimicrobiia bacterium]